MLAYDNLPRKLNVGCGYDIRPGYLNIDNGNWHKPDLVMDITDLSELPAKYFDEVVAQDVLEHIDRDKQVQAVKGWGRVLSPNGVLTIRVPSLIDMVALASDPDWQTEERQNYLIQMVYGTQAYPGDYHRCGYTPMTVTSLAEACGLVVSRAALRDRWLYDLDFKRVEASLTTRESVHNAYFCSGHTIPDEPNGVAFWVDQVEAGLRVTELRQRVAAGLAEDRVRKKRAPAP